MKTTDENGLVLCIERVLPAPRAAVYRALTEPEELREWWGPRGFTSPEVDFDPQVGGSYQIAMQPPEGDLFHLTGNFQTVDPPGRLAYSFRWNPPDPDDRETLATLTLEERGRETAIRLVQGEFATQERLALHEAGWGESFDRLESLMMK
jgi:uncharacterized protein YndB with AHSA1/START domain